MMRLDEAQQLLFMRGKVNNILVSNVGDNMAGIEHTREVSNQLRVLAMDEDALTQVADLLRQPDVRAAIGAAAPSAGQEAADEFDGPPFLAALFENIVNLEDFQTLVTALPAADLPAVAP